MEELVYITLWQILRTQKLTGLDITGCWNNIQELKNTSHFFVALRPNAGHGLLILEDGPQSVGLLWTTDQSDAETST